MVQDNTALHMKAFIIITVVYTVLIILDQLIMINPIPWLFIFGYVLSLFAIVRSYKKFK